jgi:HD-GYP domain-containing protein (c-di-GMP phosphodiesterase class II)
MGELVKQASGGAESGSMASEVVLSADDASLVEAARSRRSLALANRDLWASLVVGGAFLAVALALVALLPSERAPSFLEVAAFVVAYAFVARVEFEVGPGIAVPTQLVLVPMLFALPLAVVPICVACGLSLRFLLSAPTLRVQLERLPLQLVSSWHAVGPVVVLAAAGEGSFAWGHWPVYAAALGAQFVLDYSSAAIRQWLALGVRPRAQLQFMAMVYVVDAALAPVGLVLAALERSWVPLLGAPLVGLLAVFARERQVRIDHALELGHAYRGTALLLGDVVEADDAYTGSHSRDVVGLVVAVADELELLAEERRRAEFAALLHDVGKVRIPGEIVNKPGPLTREERRVVETHTTEGERMLEQVGGLLAEVGRIVRSCHERWDGGGYPDGLAGDDIPLAARIVCCCDAFSAMTTDRPYRPARSRDAALAELEACSGSQFDPQVVEALVRVV